jgi:predicted dehydrogenase
MPTRLHRRDALKALASTLAFPSVWARRSLAAPSETLHHASFGGSGMALADIRSLAASPHLKLVAVADVDLKRTDEVKGLFPGVRVYQDYRELLEKERDLQSVNVSTPDHMHAPITMRAIGRGLNVYTQKPLTQTLHEARQLTKAAAEKGVVSQMGIQIHSHPVHKSVVALVRGGAIGKVKEVHSWSGKQWGDRNPRPDRTDPVPDGLDWDGWVGVAEPRPFVRGWYHPGAWRKRLDFGTGTFGDMGCHILDPVYGAVGLTMPTEVRSLGGAPNEQSWGLDSVVRYTFPATPHSDGPPTLTWYDGDRRPPAEVVKAHLGDRPLSDQGSIYIGTEGVLYSPYIADPVLLPAEKFRGFSRPEVQGDDHYLQFVEACRGNGRTSTPFSYAGPLTEMVLLGCLATRFPDQPLAWDADAMRFTNFEEANRHVRRKAREAYAAEGL